MKKIEITLYNIDELKNINEKAYKNAIEKAKNIILDDRFYYATHDCAEMLKEKYNLFIYEKNIFYSISYCQGDGFCFIDKNILSYSRITKKENLNAFEKWIIDNLSKDEMSLLLEYLNCNYNLSIIKTDHHYQHAHTCKIDYEYFYSNDDQKYLDIMDDFIYKLCEKLFNNVYIEICATLENYLYSYYDIDDSDVIEFINCNDYEYTKEGELY